MQRYTASLELKQGELSIHPAEVLGIFHGRSGQPVRVFAGAGQDDGRNPRLASAGTPGASAAGHGCPSGHQVCLARAPRLFTFQLPRGKSFLT